jgi:pimeloyl-ACP methyl ester carboxylesterase
MAIMWDVETLPTVLYLHGNGGHKMEGLQLADGRVNLVALDFGACGKSQGEYLTYGEREAKDVAAVVTEIKIRYGVRKVSLWGRSMGASIGMMYASLFPRDVSCLILDTPFRWLKEVCVSLLRWFAMWQKSTTVLFPIS